MKHLTKKSSATDLIKKYGVDNGLTKKINTALGPLGFKVEYIDELVELAKNNKSNNDFISVLLILLNDLDNDERDVIYNALMYTGYDKKAIANDIIDELKRFDKGENYSEETIWFLCEYLRKLKVKFYVAEYKKILESKKYGTARQGIVYLLASLKNPEYDEYLAGFSDDFDINGQVLDALSKNHYVNIKAFAQGFKDDERKWVKKIALKY